MTKFSHAVLVVIGSELYGDCVAVAREIAGDNLLVEMSYSPPLGTCVTVHFHNPHETGSDELVARAAVDRHLAHGDLSAERMVGLRIVELVDRGEPVSAERVQ